MKGLPPQLQALLAPFYIEATELPKRRQVAQMMRQTLGVPDIDESGQQDPEVMALRQQLVADPAGDTQRHLLFAQTVGAERAGSVAPARPPSGAPQPRRLGRDLNTMPWAAPGGLNRRRERVESVRSRRSMGSSL